MNKITDKAKQLYMENYDYIEAMLHKYRVYDEDWQQIIRLGICSALSDFQPEGAKIETYIHSCLLNQLHKIYRDTYRIQKNVMDQPPVCINMSANQNDTTLEEVIEDVKGLRTLEDVECAIFTEQLLNNIVWNQNTNYNKSQQRNIEIFRLYIEGNSFEDIGKKYNLTRERVRQIVSLMQKKLKIAYYKE